MNDGEIDRRGDILDLAKLVFNDASLPLLLHKLPNWVCLTDYCT